MTTILSFLTYTFNIIFIRKGIYEPEYFKLLYNTTKITSLIIWTIGLFVEINTGYYHNCSFKNNYRKILLKYSKSIMIFDVIAGITMIYFFNYEKQNDFEYKILQIFIFFKFVTCFEYLKRLKLKCKLYGLKFHIYSQLSLVSQICFLCYSNACILVLIKKYYNPA